MSYKGIFTPTRPEKYVGKDVKRIRFLSSWERKLMIRFDTDPNILAWGSENVIIPYVNPVKSLIHKREVLSRYFVDFYIRYRDKNGQLKEALIEVKPKAQTIKPVFDSAHPRRSKKAIMTYAINEAKWKAAKTLADAANMDFMVWTEETIFGK
jgi:hypothetical protein